jgi:hypothetical protein
VLVQVTRIKHFAWCDRCLRGSPMHSFDAPLVARFFAVEELRAVGWVHACPKTLTPRSARDDAERAWSGATYCPECAARARARARANAVTPRQ